jgi:oxygen-independent coproporphyrinogen-3 oxidase
MTGRPGAYVHVPFCAHRCAYCSFVALEGKEGERGFFEGVEKEIRARAREVEDQLETVYFGGGTPSYVPPGRLGRLLFILEEIFGLSSDVEVTVEGNPDDLSAERLRELQELGVNRLSIGVQSLVDAELIPLERRHDAKAARDVLTRAVRTFGSVSGDLMIGIPGQTRESLRQSVDGLLEAGIAHLSVYLLEIEKAPKLVRLRAERPELFAGDEEMAERWEDVDTRATAAGLPRYEISNWARPGFESRHNLKYWTHEPVLGFGVSAHSFDGKTRRANTGSMTEYMRRMANSESATVSTEENDEGFLGKERVLLGLRLAGGVAGDAFASVRDGLPAESRARLADAFEAGLLERDAGRVRLTRRGVLLSNEVFSLLV